MRSRTWPVVVALLGIGLVAVSLWRFGQGPAPSSGRMTLPARSAESTQVGYRHDGPPPWPKGNCFWLTSDPADPEAPRFHVGNMHAENFERVVRDLGLETVEVMRVGEGHCLIVDPRIPREWLRDAPCQVCTPAAFGQQLLEGHAGRFRQP
jgi:hypothetical protein